MLPGAHRGNGGAAGACGSLSVSDTEMDGAYGLSEG